MPDQMLSSYTVVGTDTCVCGWCVKVKVKGEGGRVKVRVMTSRPTTRIMIIEHANTNTNLVMSQNDLLLVEHSVSEREVMGSNPRSGM